MELRKIISLIGFLTFLVVASFLGIQNWVLPIAMIVVLSFLILAIRKPRIAVLLIFFAKPMVDATWNFRVPVIGLNFLQITGVAFPVIIFLIIYSNKINFPKFKAINTYALFVFLNFISYIASTVGRTETAIQGIAYFSQGIGVLFQFLNGFAAYLILPFLFASDREKKQLFWILILAGIFPVITGLLQIGGLMAGRTLRTTGELIRVSGFYYDSTNMRMYSFQTLLAIYVYFSMYYDPKDKFALFQKLLCFILVPAALLIIYKGYSKAAIGILLSWFLIYFIFQRKILLGITSLSALAGLYVFTDTISSETEKLLYKEISYAEGNLPTELQYTLLGGRFVYWGTALDDFSRQDLASQIIGYNYVNATNTHNDFLRILISNGVTGLFVYGVLLIVFLFSLFNSFFIYRDPLAIGALMLFASFLIDSIGLVPLLYPGYCWIIFGIMSLSLNRDAFRAQKNASSEKQRKTQLLL